MLIFPLKMLLTLFSKVLPVSDCLKGILENKMGKINMMANHPNSTIMPKVAIVAMIMPINIFSILIMMFENILDPVCNTCHTFLAYYITFPYLQYYSFSSLKKLHVQKYLFFSSFLRLL